MNSIRILLSRWAILLFPGVALLGCAGTAGERAGGVERMYVLYCGEGTAPDKARWTPGVAENVKKPITLSNSCYLIKHAKGWMLWETGYSESLLAMMPKGFPTPNLSWVWKNPKTLTQQLADLGLTPAQVNFVGFSHAHPDHIGNGSLFSGATLYIQQAEYDFYLDPKGKPPSAPANWQKLRDNPSVKLKGDTDVFGDGSVTILTSTGHTPGHQSLLVKLAHTGPVLLTGDAVHFRDNWDTPRAPVQNFDKEATIKSVVKLKDVAAQSKAQVWINHDAAQTASLKMSPAYYD
jgi:glyoxylase-like metal-dependent hydrolase (beta-lactamase superfamily II)